LARDEIELIQTANRMTDTIYIGATALFFVVSAVYVRLCEKLQEGLWKSQ
jgi:hypothetical protein